MKAKIETNDGRLSDDAEQILEEIEKHSEGITTEQIKELFRETFTDQQVEDAISAIDHAGLIGKLAGEEIWVAVLSPKENKKRRHEDKIRNEINGPLTNRGFWIGCAMIAEALSNKKRERTPEVSSEMIYEMVDEAGEAFGIYRGIDHEEENSEGASGLK